MTNKLFEEASIRASIERIVKSAFETTNIARTLNVSEKALDFAKEVDRKFVNSPNGRWSITFFRHKSISFARVNPPKGVDEKPYYYISRKITEGFDEVAGDSSPTFIGVLLQARDVAHVHHWKTKSFSQHMALGELYDLLSEMVDELAEMYMGKGLDLSNVDPFKFITSWNTSSPIGFISDLHNVLENIKPAIPQDDWFVNKYEELQGSVAKIKYKLENLH